ncbi:unnamed protein product, partial [Ostreobium quekettii]
TVVGIVGFTTPDAAFMSSPGDNIEIGEDVAAIVQEEIDKLKAEGVTTVIGLSHMGFNEDKTLVKLLSGIDVVVGAHSHTFMNEESYPKIAVDKDGNKVAIVQAFWASKVVGYLEVVMRNGNVLSATGYPIILGDDPALPAYVPDDEEMLGLIRVYAAEVDKYRNLVVGEAAEFLNGQREDVRSEETNLGNMVCDAMVWYIKSHTEFEASHGDVHACLTNSGGIRASIDSGEVTFEDVLTVLPFGNVLSIVKVAPVDLYQALEN